MTLFDIPNSRSIGSGLLQGFEIGSAHKSRIMQHLIQQAQLQQQQEHFLKNYDINSSRENRLSEEHPYRIKALQFEQEMQPRKFEHLEAKIAHENANAQKALQGPDPLKAIRQQQLINSHNWNAMPASVKDNIVALGNGLGIRPDILVREMNDGKSFEEVARSNGYTPEQIENVTGKYLATAGNITLENERQKNIAELNVIENHVTEALAPYISTIGGFSMLQTIEAMKGKDPDKQAKYFAARALQPELSAIRVKVMGGNVGQGAIEELVHSSLGDSRVLRGLVTPEVYKKMQHYIAQWLKEGSKAATKSIYGRGGQSKNQTFNIKDLSDDEIDEELEANENG